LLGLTSKHKPSIYSSTVAGIINMCHCIRAFKTLKLIFQGEMITLETLKMGDI
jgi:hypothetical protein